LAQPVEPFSDNQSHVFGDAEFAEPQIAAELPRRIKDLPFLKQMLEQFLDEKRITLGLMADRIDEARRRITSA